MVLALHGAALCAWVLPHAAPRAPLARCAGARCFSAIAPTTLERQSDVMELLTAASDPLLADPNEPDVSDIVSLGLVRAVQLEAGDVRVEVELPPEAKAAGASDRLRARVAELVTTLPWVANVDVDITMQPAAPLPEGARPLQELASTLRPPVSQPPAPAAPHAAPAADGGGITSGVDDVEHIVLVASCKGGVGKSTAAVNVAYALAAKGHAVGIVDVDVHGPSLPTMVRTDAQLVLDGEMIVPHDVDGVRLMSMGFINPGAMPLRGAKVRAGAECGPGPVGIRSRQPLITNYYAQVTPVVQQLVGRTAWGKLDYLIVDMPPGTGDVQLTISQVRG